MRYRAISRTFMKVIPLGALLIVAGLSGCSDKSVEIIEDTTVVGGDDALPEGFVAIDRPENPPTSYQMPCPLREVAGSVQNPNVVPGCPTADCIPAIDEPVWGTIDDVDSELLDFERIMAVEIDGQVRGIPIRLLIYHEVVNMCWNTSAGELYSFVTYCPIVDVAQHFVRDGFPCNRKKGFSFGVSSGLFNGNLIVYQRGHTDIDGIYVQMYGGGLNQGCLEIEPVNFDITWGMFRALFPEAEVLTQNTGYNPEPYGYDIFEHPYKQFWSSGGFCINDELGNPWCFPVSPVSSALHNKSIVYGVVTSNAAKAYRISGSYVVNDEVGGERVVLWNDGRLHSTAAYEPIVDGEVLTFAFHGREGKGLPLYQDEETGSLWTFDGIAIEGPLKGKRLPHVIGYRSFWFAWFAMFPETSLHETATS